VRKRTGGWPNLDAENNILAAVEELGGRKTRGRIFKVEG